MRDHNKLQAFQLGDESALLIYRLTKHFPKEELYGLTSQMRRAAVSIPSNIVEGCSRLTEAEYLRFLEIAFGSLRELHYQLTLAERLGYTEKNLFYECDEKLIRTGKVLSGLIRSIRKK